MKTKINQHPNTNPGTNHNTHPDMRSRARLTLLRQALRLQAQMNTAKSKSVNRESEKRRPFCFPCRVVASWRRRVRPQFLICVWDFCFLLSLFLLLLAAPAQAQSTNFLVSVENYFTGINTNYTFNRVLVWDGMEYQNGVNIADDLAGSFDVYAPKGCYTGGLTVSLEGGMRNAGVAGTIVSGQGGAGLNYNYYDVRLGAYADGGYNQVTHQGYGELGVRVMKKPTQNTFIGIGLAMQLPTSKTAYPLAGVFAGVTF